MKLLYAIQGTGNGHIGRAIELAPYLMKHAELDFLISGHAAELAFPFPFKFRYHGLYFIFGNTGGVDYLKSLRSLRPIRFLADAWRCPVDQYDAVINDFEPVSAWAGKWKNKKVIAVSHQASFLSEKVPRPVRRNRAFEWAMTYFAPFTAYAATHYKAYDENIFLPLIRKELTLAVPSTGEKVVVYLPAYADDIIIPHLQKISDVGWQVFSKKTKTPYRDMNVEVFPVDREHYSRALIGARAVLIGSGFQGTAEALYLKKKLLTIPMWDQYEQLCNAAALEAFGVPVLEAVDENFSAVLADWLDRGTMPHYSFEPDPEKMAARILALAQP